MTSVFIPTGITFFVFSDNSIPVNRVLTIALGLAVLAAFSYCLLLHLFEAGNVKIESEEARDESR